MAGMAIPSGAQDGAIRLSLIHIFNSLVEVDEVVYGVFPYGIRVLHLKKVGGNVQYTL